MPSNDYLRRFELQIQYHPAFLFWNVKGALAERWGHGPFFDSVTDQGNQLTLANTKEAAADVGFSSAVAGVILSSFVTEIPTSEANVTQQGLDWLHDCLEAITPRKIVRLQVSYRWLRSARNAQSVATAFRNVYPSISNASQPPYRSTLPGVSFNAEVSDGPAKGAMAVAILGITSPKVQHGFAKRFTVDEDPALGLFYDLVLREDEGIVNSSELMPALVDEARKLSRDLIHTEFAKVFI
jgi:hypothetical protein